MNALTKYRCGDWDPVLMRFVDPTDKDRNVSGYAGYSAPLTELASGLCQPQRHQLANRMVDSLERTEMYRSWAHLEEVRTDANASVERTRLETNRDITVEGIRSRREVILALERSKQVTTQVMGSIHNTAIQCCMSPDPNRRGISVVTRDSGGGIFSSTLRKLKTVIKTW